MEEFLPKAEKEAKLSSHRILLSMISLVVFILRCFPAYSGGENFYFVP